MVTSTIMLPDVTTGDYGIDLELMTSLKLPYYTDDGEKEWKFDSGAVTSMAYDETSQIAYVVGGSTLQYINVSNPNHLDVIGHTSLANVTFYDVKTCGDFVLATYSLFNKSGLLIARTYRTDYQVPILLKKIIHDVPEPVSLAVTSDCVTAVVAISGKASWDGTQFMDPGAAVLIVSLSAILAREATDTDPVVVLDFRDFDERTDELLKKGIHFPMKGLVGLLSQDLDPSDVVIDDVNRQAYVTLQVNNAVAVIDLGARKLTRIIPLGLKDWADLDIDLSDSDGVRFQRQPIYSMNQPGAISIMRHSGAAYLLTANTGAKRDYSDIIYWKEDITGEDLVKKDLVDTSQKPELLAALRNTSQMGGLQFTTQNGLDDLTSGNMTKFVIFGARSFALRPLPDLDLDYDSGSDLEGRMAQRSSGVFNCPPTHGFLVVTSDRDLASVSMGPKPISVTSGRLGTLTLLMVGLANPGGVLLYSLSGDSRTPSFQAHWLGLNNPLRSWDQLYAAGDLAGIPASEMIFVPSDVSGQGFPLLLVAGSKSGTITVLKIKGVVRYNQDTSDKPYNPHTSDKPYNPHTSDKPYNPHTSDKPYNPHTSDKPYNPHISDKPYNPHTSDKPYNPHTSDKPYNPHTSDKPYNQHISDKPYNPHTSDKPYNPHTSDKPYNPHTSDKPYNPHISDKPYNPHTSDKPYNPHTSDKPYNPHTSDKPYNPHTSDKPYNPHTSDRPYNPHTSDRPYNPHTSDKPYNPHTSDKPYNPHTSDKPYNLHTSDKPYNPHTSDKPYNPHTSDKPYNPHTSDKPYNPHTSDKPYNPHTSDKPYNPHISDKPYNPHTSDKPYNPHTSDKPYNPHTSDKPYNPHTSDKPYNPHTFDKPYNPHTSDKPYNPHTSDKPYNPHTSDKPYNPHTSDKPYNPHTSDKPYNPHTSDKPYNPHTSDKPYNPHTSDKPYNPHTSDRPYNPHTSDKPYNPHTSDRPYNPHTSDKPYNPHTSDKPYNPHTSDKPYNPHTSDKPYNPHISDKPYNPHTSDKPYNPHTSDKPYNPHISDKPYNPHTSDKPYNPHTSDKPYNPHISDKPYNPHTSDKPYNPHTSDKPYTRQQEDKTSLRKYAGINPQKGKQ
ncbi:hypothetical protein ACOMHN_042083 [Nucella lapillus]